MPEEYAPTTRHLFEFPNGKIIVKRGDDKALEFLRECGREGWNPWSKRENFPNEFIWVMV